jgi:hypothetical protein
MIENIEPECNQRIRSYLKINAMSCAKSLLLRAKSPRFEKDFLRHG